MRRVSAAAAGLLMISGAAHAEEGACPAITTLTSGMSAAIAEAELEQAGALAAQAQHAALCQAQPHQTMLLAQLFRMSGATAYFSGDMAAGAAFDGDASTSDAGLDGGFAESDRPFSYVVGA